MMDDDDDVGENPNHKPKMTYEYVHNDQVMQDTPFGCGRGVKV